MSGAAPQAAQPVAHEPVIVPAVCHGFRLAASILLALSVAFWMQLDDPSWSGTTAAIVCQPILGAVIRKGGFRAVGTIIGALAIILLMALFPQSRVGFLTGLALWAAICCFIATLLKNFAAYAAQLAGYTAAILSASAIQDPNDTFDLAVNRASQICIGIACATLVVALTSIPRSRGQLLEKMETLVADIADRFRETIAAPLARGGGPLPETRPARRALIKRVAALDPLIDLAIGESVPLRYRSSALAAAVAGLFQALSSWRTVSLHLLSLDAAEAEREIAPVLRLFPSAWQFGRGRDGLRRAEDCRAATRALLALPAETPSARLLADRTCLFLLGLARALEGVALLRDPTCLRIERAPPAGGGQDLLPALLNLIRVFVAVGSASLLWIATAWPNGAGFMLFVTVVVVLLSPQEDAAYAAGVGFAIGACITAVIVAVIAFAVLPMAHSYAQFALVLGVPLVILGTFAAMPRFAKYLQAPTTFFVPLLSPTNQISFDTVSYYNTALTIVGGAVFATAMLALIPPVPPAIRARRLVARTLDDVRLIAGRRYAPTQDEWEARVQHRLSRMPPSASPATAGRLVAAMAIGAEILRLRRVAPGLGVRPVLRRAMAALARGDLDGMRSELRVLDGQLAAESDARPGAGRVRLRARSVLRAIDETVAAHDGYFRDIPP